MEHVWGVYTKPTKIRYFTPGQNRNKNLTRIARMTTPIRASSSVPLSIHSTPNTGAAAKIFKHHQHRHSATSTPGASPRCRRPTCRTASAAWAWSCRRGRSGRCSRPWVSDRSRGDRAETALIALVHSNTAHERDGYLEHSEPELPEIPSYSRGIRMSEVRLGSIFVCLPSTGGA